MRPAFFLAVLAFALLPARALAGIVVLKNGDVITARIDEEASDAKSLALRGPMAHHAIRASRLGDGKLTIWLSEVRFFDARADRLSAAYFEKFPTETYPLSPLFRKDAPPPPIPDPVDPTLDLKALTEKLGRLDPERIEQRSLSICKPRGWRVGLEPLEQAIDPLLVLRPDQKKSSPRIQVFVIPRPEAPIETQLGWYLEEIRKLDQEGAIEVIEKVRRGEREGRSALVLTTATRSKGQRVFARRHIVFLPGRVAFVTGYALTRDLGKLYELTDLVAATLKIKPAARPR